MPKQLHTLNKFRGVNTYKDPRDIGNDELSGCKNIMCDQDGIIRSIGAQATHGDIPANVAGLTAGYGLFYYASDHKKTLSYTGTGVNDDLEFLHGNTIDNKGEGNFTNEGFVQGMIISISGASNAANNGTFTIKIVSNTVITITERNVFTAETGSTATIVGATETGEDWLAMVDATNAEVDLYDKTSDAWSATAINMESYASEGGSSGVKGVFYFVDNALRVADGNFGNLNRTKWYGYIRRIHFIDADTAKNVYEGWYEKPDTDGGTLLDAPTELSIDAGYPAGAGAGFHLDVTHPASPAGTWLGITYQIAASFIYDDGQESLLYISEEANNTFAPAANDSLSINVRAKPPFDERVSGARIYVRESTSDDPWVLLLDIDMRDGCRAKLSGDHTAWADDGTPADDEVTCDNIVSTDPSIETYEILNGFKSSEASVDIGGEGEGYKTAVVANRRTFVANVKTKDKFGEVIHMGDRIMYTPINRFDTFPRSYFIDVVRGDAEKYIKLEEYADRLFAFKQRTLYVLNIASTSSNDWFLEATHKYMGVKLPSAVAKTEFGIVWVNESGCYLFDGNNITNLIDGKIRDEDTASNLGLYNATWSEFITDSSMVGYLPKSKQIVVLKDSSASSVGDVYIYDLQTKSWTFGDSAFTDSQIQTNFVVDYNKDLVCAHTSATGTVVKYGGDSSEVDDIEIVTKDLDFGDPGRLKKIYKIYTTYKKTDAGDIADCMQWAINGDTSQFVNTGLTGQWDGGTSDWDVAVFTFATPKSCQSIRLKLDPGTATRMFFNDITIEYRTLYKRVS